MIYPKKLPATFEGCDLLADGLLTVEQAAQFLSVCRATIYNLMDDGKLPFHVNTAFRGRRIPKAALRIFVEKM
jgi:excisionase family DNA binding protein